MELMKVTLMQDIATKNLKHHKCLTKVFDSIVIPRTGDFISDEFYEDPYERIVKGVTIDYSKNTCYVKVKEIILNSFEVEDLENYYNTAILHGWE